jgi:hypothetical protein
MLVSVNCGCSDRLGEPMFMLRLLFSFLVYSASPAPLGANSEKGPGADAIDCHPVDTKQHGGKLQVVCVEVVV